MVSCRKYSGIWSWINDGRPFWIGDFNGDGKSDVYYSTILAMITGGLVAMTAISFNGLLQEIQLDLVMR